MIRAITLLLLPGLAALAADDPGAAAMAYLESLRAPRSPAARSAPSPLDATAVSRFVGEDKRRQLDRQLALFAKGLQKELPLQIEASKTEGDLAAVLLRQWQPNDPDGPRWFPLAMILRDGRWLPAPAPGSFENALYGYDAELRRRASSLERWLMDERAARDAVLLDRQLAEMRVRMAASIPDGLADSEDPAPLVDHFLAACGRRDIDAVLALLGGLQSTLPENWPQRHRAVFAGLAPHPDHPPGGPWRLLQHPQVARAMLKISPGSADSKVAHLGCLDPATSHQAGIGFRQPPRVADLPLRLQRSTDRRWRIDLPEVLLLADPNDANPAQTFEDDWFSNLLAQNDPSSVALFPAALQQQSPPQPAPDHPTLAQRIVDTLGHCDFPGLLRLLALAGDPEQSILGHERAAELWHDLFGNENHGTVLLLDQLSAGSSGAVALQFFSATRPEAADIRILRSVRDDRGWLLAPALLDPATADEPGSDPLAADLAVAKPRWEKQAPTRILEAASRIGGLPADRSPTNQQARDAVNSWRRAILDGNAPAAVAAAAVFDNPRSTLRFLRSLGHELVGSRRNPQPGEIVAANQSGRWAAVSLRIDTPGGPVFPFYAVILGDAGPRILPEIDLFHGGSRSRTFLNAAVWTRLRDLLPETAVGELRDLFNQHSALLGDGGDQPSTDPATNPGPPAEAAEAPQ